MTSMAAVLIVIMIPRANAQVRTSELSSSSGSHHFPGHHAGRSLDEGASTLAGVLADSLGNDVAGAQVVIYPGGGPGCGGIQVASTTTGSGGSFSVSVSPGTYNVDVSFSGDAADPEFVLCTVNVDLTASADDTLTVPVTHLTVTAEDSAGDLIQGAAIETGGGGAAVFDLFPGDPVKIATMESSPATTGASGTAVIPFMPLAQSITLAVQPPSGSGLSATTIDTGLMTSDTAVTATLAGALHYQTTTTLSSAPSPSGYGQSVTFTATVSPADGGGTVSFSADGNPVTGCSSQSLTLAGANYEATCTTSSMTAGSHVIDAAYTGDTNYSGSSGTTTQTVTREPTATVLSSETAPSTYGQAVTFTATVSPADGQGTVSFVSTTGKKTAALCTRQGLSQVGDSYQASCTTSSLAAGTHTVMAAYSGDTDYAGSSATLNQTVNKTSTVTVISSSDNPSGYGQSVTFTAVVSPTDGAGTVTFRRAGQIIPGCTREPLQDDAGSYQVTCTTSSLPGGTGKIQATYSGDSDCTGSAGTLSQVVNQTPTTIMLKSSLNPSAFGETVTFTGTVSATDGGGTMTFSARGKPIPGCTNDPLTVTSGSYAAACQTTALAIGTDTIKAAYSGDAAYKGSSNTLKQRVSKP
jgi:hypothetical protein